VAEEAARANVSTSEVCWSLWEFIFVYGRNSKRKPVGGISEPRPCREPNPPIRFRPRFTVHASGGVQSRGCNVITPQWVRRLPQPPRHCGLGPHWDFAAEASVGCWRRRGAVRPSDVTNRANERGSATQLRASPHAARHVSTGGAPATHPDPNSTSCSSSSSVVCPRVSLSF